MYGAWAETGYRWAADWYNKKDIGIYAGVKPVVLSSQINANIPTSIDNSGNLVYTNKQLSVIGHATTYIRALFTQDLNKDVQWRVSGMVTSDSQYRIMNELRWAWR
jgi:hypothetical protein